MRPVGMIVKAEGPSGRAKIHSDDPKHALGLAQYLRTIGYNAWIEDTNGNEIDEKALKMATGFVTTMHPHPDAVRHPALAAGRCRPSVTSRDRITHIASDLGHAKDQGQVALRHFEYASEPRWLADFGPEWARVFFWTPRTEGS